ITVRFKGCDLRFDRYPTADELWQAYAAERIAGVSSQPSPAAPPMRRDNPAAPVLSFAQEQFWLMEQAAGGSPAYHFPIGMRLTGVLDLRALERGLLEMLRRHEVLRSRFP